MTSASRRRRKPLRLSDLPWRNLLWYGIVIAVVLYAFHSRVDVAMVHREAERIHAGLAFALLLVLPLIGFPATLLHVAAGIRFGAVAGLALVSLSILFQVVASFGIVRLWRQHFEDARWLRRIRARIPKGAHAGVCVFTALLPGVPYAAVNYALPLAGVPLGTFVACAWPIHSLRSTVTVIFGDQSADLSVGRLTFLLVYAFLILASSWWMFRRLQAQFEDPPRAAGDRTRHG